ncbi:MAG: hypothetical protein QM642_03315 [Edaphocola sp.]
MGIKQLRAFALSLPGATEDMPFGNDTLAFGANAKIFMEIYQRKWVLNDGFRLNYVTPNSRFVDTSMLHLPFTRAQQRNTAFKRRAFKVIYALTPNTWQFCYTIDSFSFTLRQTTFQI